MSFWKTLFGGGGATGQATAGKPVQTAVHNGFTIAAEPLAADGKFHIAGTISKEIGGEPKQHRFIRADTFSSREEAAKYTIIKAQQMIDQMGDRLFGP